MNYVVVAIGAFLLGCAATYAFISIRGPHTYDECMAREMHNQQSSYVIYAVETCRHFHDEEEYARKRKALESP